MGIKLDAAHSSWMNIYEGSAKLPARLLCHCLGTPGESWWDPAYAPPHYWLHSEYPQRFASVRGTLRAEGRAGTLL